MLLLPQFFCAFVQEEFENGNVVGLDVSTGEPFDPIMGGVLDNYIVKKQVRQRGVINEATRSLQLLDHHH